MSQQTITTPSYCGIFYQGGSAPTFNIPAGANAYSVTDINGATVTSGSISGSATSFIPTAPTGGWINGYYILQISGPSSYYGVFPFNIINNDARFVAAPVWATAANAADPINDSHDLISTAIAALGTYRWEIDDTNPTNTANRITAIKEDLAYVANYVNSDTSRPFVGICDFPNGGVDWATIGNINFYRRTSGTDAFSLQITTGTTANTYKLIVTDTTTSTMVETWDNLYNEGEIQAKINTSSSYLYAGNASGRTTAPTQTTVALGNAYTLATMQAVQGLYGYNATGITYFEGPSNEPSGTGDDLAARSAAFTVAVHAGNASAKALVPALLGVVSRFQGFVTGCQVIGFTPDAVSFHAYNMLDSADLPASDQTFLYLTKPMAAAGWNIPIFETEFGMFAGERGTYQPYQTVSQMVNYLTYLESVGITKEHCYYFYPTSHGFSFSSWWKNGGGTLCPQWIAARGVSERIYGMTFASRYTFTDPAAKMLFAPRWTSSTQQAILLQTTGPQSMSITLNVSGTSSLSLYDYAGNESTLNVSNSAATITANQLGVWVVAPIAATITISDINNGLLNLSPNYADTKYGSDTVVTSSTASGDQLAIANMFNSADPLTGDRTGIGDSPWKDTTSGSSAILTVNLPASRRINRVILLGCPPITDGQRNALIAFEIQYQATVGAGWTTAYTYSNSTANSTPFVGAWNVGSAIIWTQLINWDHTYSWDIPFAQPIKAVAWRLAVSSTSMGADPDAGAETANDLTLQQFLQLRGIGLYLSNPAHS